MESRYASLLDKRITESGMTLEEISRLTEKFGFKVTTSYLSKLRNGKMPPPSFKATIAIAKALGINPEELLIAGQIDNKEAERKELLEALEETFPNESGKTLAEKIDRLYGLGRSFAHIEKIGEDLTPKKETKVIKVPLLGYIAAGQPIFAEEHIQEWREIPNLWGLKEGEVFLLRVKGDSMIGSRIYDGDLVVVRCQPDVENGEIAVVNVNGHDATLKRVKKTENGQVILYPDNPKYDPIFIENEDARIVGKVIQVMFEPTKNL
ncbi:transcriptional repressor LexA [Geobacillus stearothermophilus]|uniref:transcriptional repressor LexA n=1 Tax=Geobacillus stearothermophilus TaxID=1422 RepID=UPI002402D6F6|nr:transcriptional repressor LexA [Geobacillus stearothermophilus]MDF9296053.1 transcriptional repressor LexA [Geobacillus stearothermophilus]